MIPRNMPKKVKEMKKETYWNHSQDGYSFALRDNVLHACSPTLLSCADPLLRRQKPARRKKNHSCLFVVFWKTERLFLALNEVYIWRSHGFC